MPAALPERLLAWLAGRDRRDRAGNEAAVLRQLGFVDDGRGAAWMAAAWGSLVARGAVRVQRGSAEGWAGEWLAVLTGSGAVHRSAGAPLAWGDMVTGSGGMAGWTPEAEAQLDALWAEGLSTAEIGRRLSMTKNAVVGKAHRRHLPARPSPIGVWADGVPRAPRGRVPTPGIAVMQGGKVQGGKVLGATLAALGVGLPDLAVPAAPVAVRPVVAAPPPRPVAVMPVLSRRPCCWPLWGNQERPTHRYCEAPGVPGKSYCEAHGAVAWIRLEQRTPAQLAADDSRRAKALARGVAGVPWAAG